MREVRLEIDSRVHRVHSLRTADGLWLHLDGETFFVGLATSQRTSKRDRERGSSATAGRAGGNYIVAPMPGKVTKVNVKVGDTVTAEQVLVVMDAMKMEYNLAATRGGQVKTIHVHEGSQVELDQTLVELEAVES